jgi:Ca-activated chloride channel family protein
MTDLKPQVQFIPLRDAISSDSVTNLDLIVRITVPEIKISKPRPPLNLGLVIDRSGSMEGKKIEYARKAASYAVEQLLSTDRISVTIYDDKIETIVPSTLAKNKEAILNKIKRITARNMTALYDGWLEGATQVSQHLKPEHLNRVILLSDGLANVGETNPDVIGNNVHGLSQRGVSTTTMGIGADFNEDLMQGISLSGDGNFYYIQNPEQLPSIFSKELQGIMAMIGQKVSLGIDTLNDVQLVDVFNDLDKTEFGNYKLPNLISGNNLDFVLRLKIPAQSKSVPLVDFRLAYDDTETKSRKVTHYQLELPVVNSAQLSEYAFNEEVKAKVAQLTVSRAKEEAVWNLDRGDVVQSRVVLQSAKQQIQDSNLPACYDSMLFEEESQIDDLMKDLEQGNEKIMRKKARFQSYQKRRNRE